MPKRKPLLHAKEIPLVGLDGKGQSRRKLHQKLDGQKKKRVRRDPLPWCPECEAEMKRDNLPASHRNRVRTDAFCQPLGECERHLFKKLHGGPPPCG